MKEYKSGIEGMLLPNGKAIGQVYKEVSEEVERIYIEGWAKGISIPFRDEQGRLCLANPDGSEDLVEFNREDRSFRFLSRAAMEGQGRFAYLLKTAFDGKAS
ncbi:MAG: xenobiotic reductase B [Mediterranea sp.]|jgi:hypothetical protein|nr:xenobiotic reductase B [Mediterranea sp.]